METRKTIGERMLERLDRSDRFARFARLNTGFRMGSYLFPDEITAIPQRDSSGELTHLSSAPYWERIHRLGNARLRRQQRLAALSERANRARTVSAYRRLPNLKPRSIPFFGLSSVMANDFEVLAPLPHPVEEESVPNTIQAGSPRDTAWVGAQRASSPWHTSTYRAARIAKQTSSSRPLERAVERAPASERVVEHVRRVVKTNTSADEAMPSKAAASRDELSASALGRSARRARQSLRRRANPTRLAAVDFEAALPDDFLPPTRHAQGRIATGRKARRGLRSALSSSPLMAAIDPATPRASVSDSQPLRTKAAGTIGQTASRRVAHRAQGSAQSLLSASPVHSPATVAPSALTVLGPSEGPQVVGTAEEAQSLTATKKPTLPPMVRALERAESPSQPLHERPLSERAPVAVRPVKTRSGVFAPETSVLIPGIVPEDATTDADPLVAEPRARRRSQAANALQRATVPGTLTLDSTVSDAGLAAVDRGTVDEATTGRAAKRLRPHKVARKTDGTFVPAAEILSTSSVLQSAEARVARGSESAVRTDESAPELKAAARLDTASKGSSNRRRRPTTAEMGDTEVLAPLFAESEEVELPPGQHAAERAGRTPVVAESVRKALGIPATTDTKGAANLPRLMTPAVRDATHRPVSPKHFRSPLSHIQVRRSATSPGPKTGPTGSITLQASPEHGVREGAGDQQARQAALGQVQQAWERSGRPLDWTSARIEVIQVAEGAVSGASEPSRSLRTAAGAYVPATGQTVQSRLQPAPEGSASGSSGQVRTMNTGVNTDTVLARPESGPMSGDGQAIDDATSIDPTQPEAMNSPRSRRTGFDATMGGVGAGRVGSSMPIWAQRSTGRPRITGGDDLVQQLARASAPEDVVSVLMDQSDSVRRATSSLPTPVVQVIQQIKTEAVRAEGEAEAAERTAAATARADTVRQRTHRREGVRSTTRVVRGMTGLNPGGGTARAPSAAMDRVGKLAKRLQELIAMAENQNRSGARQEVRMAEDSGAARAEGQSAPTSAADGGDASADIDTLAREVTEQVTRELEMRRERRQEDPDGRSIWW